MESLTNAIGIICSVQRLPHYILTQAQVSDILETTFCNPAFLDWHLRRQRWIRTQVRCSPVWKSRLITLTSKVGNHLLTATSQGDLLAAWTDGKLNFPIKHYDTPRSLINSALESLHLALWEFREISANLASFNQQFDCIRHLIFGYLKQVLEYSIILRSCCLPAPADAEESWFFYEWQILDHLPNLFRFDLPVKYWWSIEKQGDRSLNGVIPPPHKMLPHHFAAKPTHPTFVKQERVYGKALVKIEEVPKDWKFDMKKVKCEVY
jgi:hypothetical protein